MKNQTHLSELDATKLALMQARERLFVAERDAFYGRILAVYGNPNEALSVADDGRTLIRKAAPPPPKQRKR